MPDDKDTLYISVDPFFIIDSKEGGGVIVNLSGKENFNITKPLDVFAMEIGYCLVPLVDCEQEGELLKNIRALKKMIHQETGVIMPPVHITDNPQFKPGEYRFFIKGNVVARGDLMPNHLLAMDPGIVKKTIKGIATNEPTYGFPALWIKESQKEEALANDYMVVDQAAIINMHLYEIAKKHLGELFSYEQTLDLLNLYRDDNPSVIHELESSILISKFTKVLRHLLNEQIPILDIVGIAETVLDHAWAVNNSELLSEYTRQSLKRTITALYSDLDGYLYVIKLSPAVEQFFLSEHSNIKNMVQKKIDWDKPIKEIRSSLSTQLYKARKLKQTPVIICSAPIRRLVKSSIFIVNPCLYPLNVISYDEVSRSTKVKMIGIVDFF